MIRSKYFNLQEMTYSHTAILNDIDNTPTEEHLENIKELMTFLDDMRESWGNAIIVTSGYRCKELNEKIKGSKTSVHPLGLAADVKPANNKMDEFKTFVKEWAKDKDFDQILFEKNSQGGRWVHVGLKNKDGKQRKQVKDLSKK